jgi:hypothetical protein
MIPAEMLIRDQTTSGVASSPHDISIIDNLSPKKTTQNRVKSAHPLNNGSRALKKSRSASKVLVK